MRHERTMKSSLYISVICGLIALGLEGCNPPKAPPKGKPKPGSGEAGQNPGPSPDNPSPDNPSSDPGENPGSGEDPSTEPSPDPKEEPAPPGWSLRSPAAGSSSSDTTPQILGSAFSGYAGGKAKVFSDSSCSKLLGEAEIAEDGSVRVASLRFKDDKSEDGLKTFYASMEKGQTASKCEDMKLSYTLKTDAPLAKARFVRAMFKDDPASTMNIGFDMRSSSKAGVKIFYDVDDHGRDTQSYAFNKELDKTVFYKGMFNAFSQLKSLKPDTIYYFVIQDGEGVSPVYSVRTLPDNPDVRLSIVAGGDSRNNREPRRNANLLVAKLRPHVVLFGGDMTNLGSTIEWIDWFEDWESTIGADRRLTPVVVTRGNHELSNNVLENLFDIAKENYYALNFGGNLIRAYTLNTESSVAGTQTEWLLDDLKKNTNTTWRIAQYHVPMRPHVADKSEGSAAYQNWAKPFFDYKMDLVIESDSHTVKTTWPLEPSSASGNDEGFVRNDEKGTVYLGEGCWGAPLRSADDAKSWTRDSGAFNHFNWLFVDQDKIEIRTIKVDNASKVGTLGDGNRFDIPSGIDVWTPKNGDLIMLAPKK